MKSLICSCLYIIILWSHMTSLMRDLTWFEQFHIITYCELDLPLIICHLTYLIFLINQSFELTLKSNFLVDITTSLLYITFSDVRMYEDTFLLIELHIIEVVNLHADCPLVQLWNVSLSSTPNDNVDESRDRRSLNLLLEWMIASSVKEMTEWWRLADIWTIGSKVWRLRRSGLVLI